MPTYMLRNISDELWLRIKFANSLEGGNLRNTILRLIDQGLIEEKIDLLMEEKTNDRPDNKGSI